MRELTVYRQIFYNADCYTRGTYQQNIGVQVHSTGANNPWLRRYVQPDDGRIGKNKNGNSHNRPGTTVCAGAYIGKQKDGTVAVYEALPENMRCWLSGNGPSGNANRIGYFGFEICEDGLKDEAYFREAVLGVAVNYTAWLCRQYGTDPLVKDRFGRYPVMDHAELHAAGIASNHGDITAWLRKYGYNMHQFRALVSEAIQDGIEVTYVDCNGKRTLRKGDSGEDVRELQEALNTLLYNAGEADGKFGAKTEAAVRLFQTDHGLTADGICGPNTWTALNEASDSTQDEDGGEVSVPKGDDTTLIAHLRDMLSNVYTVENQLTTLIKKAEEKQI